MQKIKALLLLGTVLALLMTACVATAPSANESESSETPAAEAAATAAPEEEGTATGPLAGVCPDPVVIQTDWFPEAEHAALYQLLGDEYTVDTDRKAVNGPLISGGAATGVGVEIRTGGPAIGFQQPIKQMYVEDDITLGYVSTDEAIFGADDTPTIAVMAPLEKNPQIIMWDPETYPDVETIADLGEAGVIVNVFAGGTFIDVFVSEGILSADQVDPSYDGSPARWVAENGAIAQQGFASAEPYTYENEIDEWGKPVAFELIHDAGLELYSQSLAIRAADLEELRPCLELLIPMIQQAVVDYAAAPAHANAIIVDAVAQYNDFWVYNEGLAEFSVAKQLELGLIGNGPDATVGNMDLDRVQGVINKMVAAGLDINADLQADTIATNEFIDESIGLP
ncbi:MAG TPA: hypothetical protein P5121_20075 [Caldilineaceae bacterium]|nr:hypothetical protein [Caldilineaceae bacterium]